MRECVMKILVTAFEPFNGRDVNPSQLILEQLEAPEGVTLMKELLPVEFKASTEILKMRLKDFAPHLEIEFVNYDVDEIEEDE